jgi:hypothetical protein
MVSVASIEAFLSKLAMEQQGEGFVRAVAREHNTGRRGKRSEGTEQSATSQEAEGSALA